MHKLVDTETASFEGGVCEIGSILIDDYGVVRGEPLEQILDPEAEIGFGAMGIHNITPEMVEGQPKLSDVIEDHIPDKDYYFIAHNAKFDMKMLRLDQDNTKHICTLELARLLYPTESIPLHGIPDHKNMTLFYALGCYKTFKYSGVAHRAGYDVSVTAAVLKAMMDQNNLKTLDEVYTLLNQPPKPFGERDCWMKKYRGLTWDEVAKKDKSYLVWIKNNYDFKNNIEFKDWVDLNT